MPLSQNQIKFDVIGSFLPPESLVNAKSALAENHITPETYSLIEDDAVRTVIGMQLRAGLPYVTSGDIRRHHRCKDFYFGLHGIQREYIGSGHLYQPTDAFTDTIRICDRISYNPGHPFFEDFIFLRDCVGNAAICRQSIPSPTQLYIDILTMTDGRPERIYPDIVHLLDDIAGAYRLTIRSFYNLGCRSLLLDDTVFGRLCDMRVTKRILQGGIDMLRLHEDLIILFNLALEEIPADMDIAVYLSAIDNIIPKWHNAALTDSIIPKALAGLDADTFILPFDPKDKESINVLQYVADGKKVTLGLLSATTHEADSISDIATAMDIASHYIPAERLTICPIGGFRTENATLGGLTYDEQWRKINVMPRIAETLYKLSHI